MGAVNVLEWIARVDWLPVLTGALVLITAYYAWQTHRMASEMGRARGVALLPKPAPTMTYLAPDVAMPTVINAGPGTALNVYLEMWLEPGNGHRRQWRTPVLAPGERHEFILKQRSGSGVLSMTEITKTFRSLRVRGTFRDALGSDHTFDESVDIAEWWELLKASGERIQPDHPKTVADSLKSMANNLRK